MGSARANWSSQRRPQCSVEFVLFRCSMAHGSYPQQWRQQSQGQHCGGGHEQQHQEQAAVRPLQLMARMASPMIEETMRNLASDPDMQMGPGVGPCGWRCRIQLIVVQVLESRSEWGGEVAARNTLKLKKTDESRTFSIVVQGRARGPIGPGSWESVRCDWSRRGGAQTASSLQP